MLYTAERVRRPPPRHMHYHFVLMYTPLCMSKQPTAYFSCKYCHKVPAEHTQLGMPNNFLSTCLSKADSDVQAVFAKESESLPCAVILAACM